MSKKCGSDAIEYTYQLGTDEAVSEGVARTVAAVTGRDQRGPSSAVPTDNGLAPPLYAVVDPDALDDLFAPTTEFPRERGTVSFPFAGYQMAIEAAGVITLSKI